MDDNTPRSDPYSDTYPNYDHIPIPPPPPGFQSEPTVPPHFGITPTVKASPPPTPKPAKPPKKRKDISARRAIGIYFLMFVVACALLIIGATIMSNLSHRWTVIQTYDNYRAQHVTEALIAPNNWRIVWQCTNTGAPEPIIINFYDANGGLQNLVSDTCQDGTRRGVAGPIAQGGNITIDINSNAIWTVDVQEQTSQ